ncbi:MAG: UPF0182 family protein [Austwickia sp.]|nr:UPF0182 family protein [Austwickia sp.]MBK8435938.1 UPF0182 family protein [Austwickia sp.]MBK9101622.1 UPF0182 family protein [Austwickia sp.]
MNFSVTPRKPGPLGITAAVLAAVVIAAMALATWITEIWWYESVGFNRVFWTQLGTQAALFLIGAVVVGALVASSLLIGYRTRPVYAPTTQRQQVLDHYRAMIEPLRRVAMWAAPAVLGAFAGMAAASQWKTMLLFMNRQPFGVEDPTFNLDVGFFVFTLPWLKFLESFLTMALVLALIAAAFTHYVYGGLQLGDKGTPMTRAARVHLSLLAAAFVIVRALGYWLDRYQLSVKDSQRITGLTYTDVNAVLPTKAILTVAAILCAGLFIATIWTTSWRLPIISVGLLLVTSLLFGGIYPLAVQEFKVKPSEQSLEEEYIAHNIKATLAAYGLDKVEQTQYPDKKAQQNAQQQIREAAEAIPGIRIVDPLIVSAAFKQGQAPRQYHQLPDVLDVDRYTVNGKVEDTVIAVRELAPGQNPQPNWVNNYTVYTHGYGVIAAYGTRKAGDGRPVFFSGGIPAPMDGPLGRYEPRIYFGELSREYSIVGAPEGTPPRELDYESSGEVRSTYQGSGGVPMGNLLQRMAYAIKYREVNILLADQVNASSKMLDYRTPKERVERVAPWLTLDGNAYPAVVNGRVLWILDGYTTSANYPYSKLQPLEQSTSDSLTRRTSNVTEVSGQVNYIRNSVKATVDAYDGSVTLYAWDEQEPVLKAWTGAFGNTVKPLKEISGQLMSHLRYPEDLFKVQRQLLTRYHVQSAGSFFGAGDYWKVPLDPTVGAESRSSQPPYYLSIAMPGQESPSFQLTGTFSPLGGAGNLLSGFLAVDADAGDQAGKPRAGYGKLRLLKIPNEALIEEPGQIQNKINAATAVTTDDALRGSGTLNNYLNISNQNNSRVARGNLLTLPVSNGVLNIQPIYVSGAQTQSYPLLQVVVAVYGPRLAWGSDLKSAMDQLFGGDTGTSAPTTPTPAPTPGQKPPAQSETLRATLAQAQRYYQEGRTALAKGDFAAYGKAQENLKKALDRAMALSPSGGAVTLTPAPSPAPAPAPAPSPAASAAASAAGLAPRP